jgi:LDH2 family malate/lactate/ureidoglycolate dehydrogenase
MVGMAVANTLPMTAPYGGRDGLMSVAPFALTAPAGVQKSILGDVALSQVYDCHSIHAVENNERLGGKWMADPDTGKLTDDPSPYVADPHQRASRIRAAGVFADPRLYCLNVFSEVMTGLTTPGGRPTNEHEYPTRDHVERGGAGERRRRRPVHGHQRRRSDADRGVQGEGGQLGGGHQVVAVGGRF